MQSNVVDSAVKSAVIRPVIRLPLLRDFGGDSSSYILALAKSFPCLEPKIRAYNPARFPAEDFEKVSRAWSSGERHCALFVLAVWSGENWKGKGKAFDLVHAASCVDRDDLEIIFAWVMNPQWP